MSFRGEYTTRNAYTFVRCNLCLGRRYTETQQAMEFIFVIKCHLSNNLHFICIEYMNDVKAISN